MIELEYEIYEAHVYFFKLVELTSDKLKKKFD